MSKNALSIIVPMVVLTMLGCALAVLLSGAWSDDRTGTLVQDAVTFPEIQLVDQHNRKAALVSELIGEDLIVVTFNYTTCESICGVGNAIMQKVDQSIGLQTGRKVRLLSITINPTVDTPTKLAQAAAVYEPTDRWLWTTGRPADIETVLKQANAQVADIELHQLVFIVGDGKRKTFRRLPTSDPDAADIIAALKDLDS